MATQVPPKWAPKHSKMLPRWSLGRVLDPKKPDKASQAPKMSSTSSQNTKNRPPKTPKTTKIDPNKLPRHNKNRRNQASNTQQKRTAQAFKTQQTRACQLPGAFDPSSHDAYASRFNKQNSCLQGAGGRGEAFRYSFMFASFVRLRVERFSAV